MDSLHYALRCECAADILLPLEAVGQWFASQQGKSKDIEPIVVVCDRCKRVRNYDLTRKSPNPPFGPLVSVPVVSEWAYLGWVECEDKSCKIHLPIFARLNQAISPEQRERESLDWIWDGVRCLAGHTIPKPVLRLEPPCSLNCPSCGAPSWEEPRNWFEVGKRIECVFCGKFLMLTEEHISKLESQNV
jgi:hypothetical protein